MRATPWTAARAQTELVPRLESVPRTLSAGLANLQSAEAAPVRTFANVALSTLGWNATRRTTDVGAALCASVKALSSTASLPTSVASELSTAASHAAQSLSDFALAIDRMKDGWATNASIGEARLQWFLHHVSLVNRSSDAILQLGRSEFERVASAHQMTRARNDAAGLPPDAPRLFPSFAAQQNATLAASRAMHTFLAKTRLLTLPSWLPEYTVEPIPPWLHPFGYGTLGEEDDFTSATRSLRGDPFVRWLPPPRAGLPIFLNVLARDPRPVLVHEGLPGHFAQFSFSWRNKRPARRQWLDSIANEGLAFYWEESVLLAGLYSDAPRVKETVYELARLRAVRVEADVGLATGALSVAEAAAYLERAVPLSPAEAAEEVAARLAAPGQGMSYVVGRAQLLAFLEASREAAGAQPKPQNGSFDLARFHASLMANGNLPFALQAHAAGLNSSASLPTPSAGFVNVHTAFEGVPLARRAQLAADPGFIRGLPRMPPASLPAMTSGYLPVGHGKRELFYWLVHAASPVGSAAAAMDDESTPMVIWLQGGNGCSSLIGALSENGPFVPTPDGGLDANPFSWHRMAHMLYLDRPAGAGYSFSRVPFNETWANDATTATDSVEALRALLVRSPWLCNRSVWVAGESYAGHFTIQLANALMDAETQLCVRVGGVLSGNGVVDINQTNYAWFETGDTHSLVSSGLWPRMRAECDFTKDLGIDGNGCPRGVSAACAKLVEQWMVEAGADHGLSLYDLYADVCLDGHAQRTEISSSWQHAAEEAPPRSAARRALHARARALDPCIDERVTTYLNLPEVRRAMHVSPDAPAVWEPCSQPLNDAYSCADTLVSVAPLYKELLERGRRLLVYSGDVDDVVPTLATRRWIDALELPPVQSWRPWKDSGGQLGGYEQSWAPTHAHGASTAQLKFATVRGAGHQVPTFQPRRAFDLVRRFVLGQSV